MRNHALLDRIALRALFFVLATLLLIGTLRWHIPMMLWDHLDFVPIYQAWMEGDLARSGFWTIHGGHFHTAAYAVLLATTWLSGGHPWLDCTASWLLLIGYASVVVLLARASFPAATRTDRAFLLLVVFLALYPGHLANLQWGWQVAVFLCLLGVVLTIFFLTRERLSWREMIGALLAFALAFFSFATAIALLPTALILIALRNDHTFGRRIACALPWIAIGIAIAFAYPTQQSGAVPTAVAVYALNFLGAGIARFASEAAPWLAAIGVVWAVWACLLARHRRDGLPWIGFVVFAVFAALLAGLGRAGAYGADQAFVTRYVSFASVFWLGLTGLLGCTWTWIVRGRVARCIGVALVALLSALNALHMVHKAAEAAARTRNIAQTLRSTYPQVDHQLLKAIYFDHPDIALARLHMLHDLGFAPFTGSPAVSTPGTVDR